MIDVINARKLRHLVHAQQVEMPQRAEHQRRENAAHCQGHRDGCTRSKKHTEKEKTKQHAVRHWNLQWLHIKLRDSLSSVQSTDFNEPTYGVLNMTNRCGQDASEAAQCAGP